MLKNVELELFSPNTTNKFQTLDAGIAAAMTVRCSCRQMEHAADLLDVGVTDLYETRN